jgi:hypothetical protein
MAFSDLTARLTDPRLQTFAAAWARARGSRMVPRWRDLDIAEMVVVAPYIWAWEYERETATLRGKLAGEEIQTILGRGFRGASADAYFKGDERRLIQDHLTRVILEAVGMVTTGQVFGFAGSNAAGQRLALPVATRAEAADTVLGVTLYKFAAPPRSTVRGDLGYQDVEFFTLE